MIHTLMTLTFASGIALALGATSPAFSAEGSNFQAATGTPAIQAGQGQDFADNSVDLADDNVGGDIDVPNWTDEADNTSASRY